MTTLLRKFGIELECGHRRSASQHAVAEGINLLGYHATSASYTGHNYSVWQIKTDASLSGFNGGAIEVVSRILPPTEASLEEVRKITKWLNDEGYVVNITCGFHIHIDVSDLSEQERHAVAYRYHLHQDEIKTFLPPSRWNGRNHFAQFLPASDPRLAKLRRAIADSRAAAGTAWNHGERYSPCNLEHRGRIEFRQAGATLDASKIIGWYKTQCAFIQETVKLVRAFNAQPVEPVRTTPQPSALRGSVVVRQEAPRVPNLTAGTDAHYFTNKLIEKGWISDADRREGWPDTRLRVTAHALRNLGANIEPCRIDGHSAYRIVGSNAGNVGQRARRFTAEEIFSLPVTVRSRANVARQQPAPAPSPSPRESLESILRSTPYAHGFDADIVQWIEERKSIFAEDVL